MKTHGPSPRCRPALGRERGPRGCGQGAAVLRLGAAAAEPRRGTPANLGEVCGRNESDTLFLLLFLVVSVFSPFLGGRNEGQNANVVFDKAAFAVCVVFLLFFTIRAASIVGTMIFRGNPVGH